jgi:predicted Zn-ribbon and HTH transcriptional regulator
MPSQKECKICGAGTHSVDPPVQTIKTDKGSFDVCADCITKKICPQCIGNGTIFLKRGTAPAAVEKCDLCFGTGTYGYSNPLSTTEYLEDYKIIKVPTWVYNNLKQSKMLIERKKQYLNPTIVSPTRCPKCNHSMDSIKAKFEYFTCPNCHYTQQKVDLNASGNIALGFIIGLGVAALINSLSEDKKK